MALSDYSVKAWIELAFPNHRIRVEKDAPNAKGPKKNEILVLLTGERFSF